MASKMRMFRRSLTAMAAAIAIGLGATIGYVVLGLSGPETTFMDAEAAYRRASYTEAINLLDRAERSVGVDATTALFARILYLRRQAYLMLENYPRALDDIQALIDLNDRNAAALPAVGIDVEMLEMERVYYLLRNEQVELALTLIQRWLEDHDATARTLELAGEAAFASFAEQYRSLRESMDSGWEIETAREADTLLKGWLYRDESDPAAQRSRETFDGLLRDWQPSLAESPRFRSGLQELRRKIQQAQEYCRRAIVAPGGQPVAAYQLLRTSLEKGGRSDDIQALAEIYCLLFDHIYTVDAAVDLADLHIEHERYRAAIEVRERFLPRGQWRQRYEAGRLSSVVKRLFVAEARALQKLEDNARAEALLKEVDEIEASGLIDLSPEIHMVRALCLLTRPRDRTMRTEIQTFFELVNEQPRTEENRAQLYLATQIQIDIARRLRWTGEYYGHANRRLATYGPEIAKPWIEAAEIYLENSLELRALECAQRAIEIEAHNDDALRVLAKAYDYQDRRSARGAIDLLNHFAETRIVPANISRSELWPLITELALEKRMYAIALECARRSSEQFNWAKWPRVLEFQAAMALEDYRGAMEAAQGLLTFFPGDAEGEKMLETARLAAGLPVDDLLYGALLNRRDDAQTAMTLLTRAQERGADHLARAIADKIRSSFREDPRAQAMIASYYVEQRDLKRANEAIHLAARFGDPTSPLFAETRALLLMIAAISGEKAKVPALLRATKENLHGQTEQLFRYAKSLAELDRDKLVGASIASQMAFELIDPVLNSNVHREARNGAHYHFGGMLALRLGRVDLARKYLLAALPFEEGQAASRALTLLYLREQNGPSPVETFLEPNVTDLVSACLHARCNRRVPVLGWVDDTLQSDPLDLPALCLRAMFGETGAATPPELSELIELSPQVLLDLLTFLEADGFEPVAAQLALQLNVAHPGNRFAQFFIARALANGGDGARALQHLAPLAMPTPGKPPFVWAEPELQRLFEANLREGIVAAVADDPAREKQVELLANLWRLNPTRAQLEDVEFLIENGQRDIAFEVMNARVGKLAPEERAQGYAIYFRLADQSIESNGSAETLASAVDRARKIIESEAPYGAVVNFLLDHHEAEHGELDSDRQAVGTIDSAIALLLAHVQLYLRDEDPDVTALLATIDRLRAVIDRSRLLELTESILRKDSSLIEVWTRRARWLAEDGLLGEGYDSVAWIRDYLPSSPAQLMIAELRARAGVASPDDLGELRKNLAPVLFDSNEAALARGMIALRSADYADASDLLGRAMPASDGAHIYFRAIADLALGKRDDASALFAKLATDYPTSVLSDNAEQFAKFLSQ